MFIQALRKRISLPQVLESRSILHRPRLPNLHSNPLDLNQVIHTLDRPTVVNILRPGKKRLAIVPIQKNPVPPKHDFRLWPSDLSVFDFSKCQPHHQPSRIANLLDNYKCLLYPQYHNPWRKPRNGVFFEQDVPFQSVHCCRKGGQCASRPWVCEAWWPPLDSWPRCDLPSPVWGTRLQKAADDRKCSFQILWSGRSSSQRHPEPFEPPSRPPELWKGEGVMNFQRLRLQNPSVLILILLALVFLYIRIKARIFKKLAKN